MKIILTIALSFLSLQNFAQDMNAQYLEKRYTHGAENGYSWLDMQKHLIPLKIIDIIILPQCLIIIEEEGFLA